MEFVFPYASGGYDRTIKMQKILANENQNSSSEHRGECWS